MKLSLSGVTNNIMIRAALILTCTMNATYVAMGDVITQNPTCDIDENTMIVCGNIPASSTENWLARNFYIDQNVTINSISWGSNVFANITAEFYFSTASGSGNPEGVTLTQVGSAVQSIDGGPWYTTPVDVPFSVTEGSYLVVEVRFPESTEAYFIPAGTSTATAPTYIKTDACGITTYQDLGSDVGFPEAQIIMCLNTGEGLDCNGNGIPDDVDIANGTSNDKNGNGIPDECEDCNGNGVLDSVDITTGTSEDCNDNGTPDECDIADGTSQDADGNGVPDECEDCNENGVPDSIDIADGTSYDCDQNGEPDECQPDCDGDGFIDPCDNEGDCDEDGLPDNCEIDCNENGIPDDCDILYGLSEDCNENGIPDECDIASGEVEDCNLNDVPDECDINSGKSKDIDGNGIPDECEFPGILIVDDKLDDDPNADFQSIHEAINASYAGGEILVMPGTYFQDPKNLILLKNKPLWIHSSDGPAVTIIDGQDKCRAIDGLGEVGTTLIEGFTIKKGDSLSEEWSGGGGGIRWTGGELVLRDCIFEYNHSKRTGGGGAIYDTDLTIEYCIFRNNSAILRNTMGGHSGGLNISSSNATIRNTDFIDNAALGSGTNSGSGGLGSWASTLTLKDCVFENNTTDCWSGGIGFIDGMLFAEGCEFINNTGSFGGALYLQQEGTVATVTNCNFLGNSANVSNDWGLPAVGGGILLNYSTQAYVSNCTFTNNIAKDDKVPGAAGGGIASWPQSDQYAVGLVVSDCIFIENEAEIDGGGIWIQSFGEPTNETDQPALTVQLTRKSVERSSVSHLLSGDEKEGACCKEGDCIYVPEELCVVVGGEYQGNGSTCETSNCGLLGACCLIDQPCMNVFEDECNNAGGTWQGKLTWCATTYCSGVSGTDFYCNLPTDIYGDWEDLGNNNFLGALTLGDVTGDSVINVNDLIAIIGYWGSSIPAGDINEDGIVDVGDLLIVISNWGPVICEYKSFT
jgi:hypothetical protein